MSSQIVRSIFATRPVLLRSSKHVIAPLSRAFSGEVTNRFDKSLYPRPDLAPPTYDQYPLPQGDWKEDYDKHQSKFNKQLALGTITFIGALVYLLSADDIDWGGPPKGVIGVNPPYFSVYPENWPKEKRIP